jgi:hypothetical protein
MLEKLADDLARDFAKQVFLVDGIAEADAGAARIRALQPYFVKARGGNLVVLADTQLAAAELVAITEGAEVAVSCLLGRHRVVPLPRGGWAVAALPGWLGFLGKSCEHGGHAD